MNKLKFINHSSFNITNGKVSLSVDPWIEGLVFNNSWSLLSKTPEKCIETVKDSDYIWFSHEHPDHFNPPDVKLFGKNKKFLFQKKPSIAKNCKLVLSSRTVRQKYPY